jgi:hypothetical protein
VTRIPELENELVAAAARLRSPRRVLRPAARAALVIAAVAVVVVIAVVGVAEHNDGGQRRLPSNTAPGARLAIDGQAGVQFRLDGRVLTVGLLPYAPPETRSRLSAARIRATCGVAFAQVGPEGDPRNFREEHTRFWPADRRQMSFTFSRDLSGVTWCRLEDPAVGHVAFVRFTGTATQPGSAKRAVELAASEWARLFAAADPAACERYMAQPACERVDCRRVGGRKVESCTPVSAAFRNSFRDARIEEVAVDRKFAGVRFSNGETVRLIHVEGTAPIGVWWIEEFGGDAGRKLLGQASGR